MFDIISLCEALDDKNDFYRDPVVHSVATRYRVDFIGIRINRPLYSTRQQYTEYATFTDKPSLDDIIFRVIYDGQNENGNRYKDVLYNNINVEIV